MGFLLLAFAMGMNILSRPSWRKRSIGMIRMHVRNAKPATTPPIARTELPALDLLRSFEAAARHLSFTLAAQELFLTQSAVSRQIQQVEASLGVSLFERRHRSLV